MLLSLGIQVGAMHDVGEQQHLDEECSRDSSDGSGCGRQGEQVQQENAGVGGADAVVDPHTVVVEAMHTRPADTSRRQGQNECVGTSFLSKQFDLYVVFKMKICGSYSQGLAGSFSSK